MSLPFILDVTIGLIFIYLILSLLASEIQELITTVLQWRAVHLKKSIEILIAGDAIEAEKDSVIDLVNDLYDHPLIKSVNQEATGFLTTLPRKFVWFLSSIPIKLSLSSKKRTKNIFGYTKDSNGDTTGKKRSAPSYISAEAFATTLMERLEIPKLVQKLTESRLMNFKDEQLHDIQNIILKFQGAVNTIDDHIKEFSENIYDEFTEIVEINFEKIIEDFQKNKTDLTSSINRMAQIIDRYIETFQEDMPENEYANKALQQLKFLRQDTFDNVEQTICLKGLRPNINEVVELMNVGSNVYKGLANEFKNQDSEAYKTFQAVSKNIGELSKKLPPSVVSNMAALAKRAEIKAKTTEEGIYILKKEIEQTFDNSMERASGVYKRNAKGVAILIGFGIAIIANADAFHIVSRLSKDSGIRAAIVNSAGQIVQNNKSGDLESVKNQTEKVLTEISLPVGWTNVNLKQQLGWEENEKTDSSIVQSSLNPEKPLNGASKSKFKFSIQKFLTTIFGWFVSGIAISMGAPFWFDLLGKVVNVRNAGKPPASSAGNQSGNS
jgi:hypothetical protein